MLVAASRRGVADSQNGRQHADPQGVEVDLRHEVEVVSDSSIDPVTNVCPQSGARACGTRRAPAQPGPGLAVTTIRPMLLRLLTPLHYSTAQAGAAMLEGLAPTARRGWRRGGRRGAPPGNPPARLPDCRRHALPPLARPRGGPAPGAGPSTRRAAPDRGAPLAGGGRARCAAAGGAALCDGRAAAEQRPAGGRRCERGGAARGAATAAAPPRCAAGGAGQGQRGVEGL